MRKNWVLILIGLATTALGIIAVVTAVRLYQLRKQPVAPTVPVSKPKAVSPQCTLTFSISLPTNTPTPTITPTATPSPTSTPTLIPTHTPTPTVTPTPTLTPTPTFYPTTTPISPPQTQATPTPTTYVAQVELPQAGVTLPTLGAVFGGVILLLTSLLLIF